MMQPEKLIQEFTEESRRILKDDLTGVYLHGSLVMGCFHPEKSDIDLITVVKYPLSFSVKREYLDMVVKYNALGPAKGIEMSIVLEEACSPFVYPTPYELHFSSGHLEHYRKDPEEYIREMKGTDKDLAAHFMILNRRGRCLTGQPIREVFAEVPDEDYLDAILYDVENAEEEISAYPMYLTLNLARVLAYREEQLVLSKKEGGEWALSHLPALFHPLIRAALNEYCGNAGSVYDGSLAKEYAAYVLRQIRRREEDPDPAEQTAEKEKKK